MFRWFFVNFSALKFPSNATEYYAENSVSSVEVKKLIFVANWQRVKMRNLLIKLSELSELKSNYYLCRL